MRRWISLLLSFSFIILLFSGIVLYIEPHGRIAFWIDWHLFGLDKHQWDALHTVFSFLFLIFAIWHLVLNIRALKKYFFYITSVFVSLIFICFVIWGTIAYKPPFSWVIDLQQQLKHSWSFSPPPIPHAEQMSLGKVARLIGLEPKKALEILQKQGIKVNSPKEKFGKIAKENGYSPSYLFKILQTERK